MKNDYNDYKSDELIIEYEIKNNQVHVTYMNGDIQKRSIDSIDMIEKEMELQSELFLEHFKTEVLNRAIIDIFKAFVFVEIAVAIFNTIRIDNMSNITTALFIMVNAIAFIISDSKMDKLFKLRLFMKNKDTLNDKDVNINNYNKYELKDLKKKLKR